MDKICVANTHIPWSLDGLTTVTSIVIVIVIVIVIMIVIVIVIVVVVVIGIVMSLSYLLHVSTMSRNFATSRHIT